MNRLHDERGAGIILIIGVIAALAIMGTTLVVLIGNTQHNTYRDRMNVKSSSVAEAALDVGMANLSGNWPTSAAAGTALSWTASTPLPGATNATAFRGMFSPTEFPNPEAGVGVFSLVSYEDNPPSGTPLNYDASGPLSVPDEQMYVTAQAGVGPTATRIKVLVEVHYIEFGLPRGIALFSGGNLLSNGGGNNPKIVIDPSSPPPPGTQATIRIVGNPVGNPNTIDDPSVADQSKYAELTGTAAGSAEDIFPTVLINSLKETAQAHGRYFSGANAISLAENSLAVPGWSEGGLTGLTVIEPSATTTLTIKGDYNSVAKPGVLLLLGGSNLDFGGGGNYYGALYTQGTVDKGHGNFIIHGMLVATSTVDMRGTVNISYNDACIANLDSRFPSNVRIVPNTWRELQPVF